METKSDYNIIIQYIYDIWKLTEEIPNSKRGFRYYHIYNNIEEGTKEDFLDIVKDIIIHPEAKKKFSTKIVGDLFNIEIHKLFKDVPSHQ